jgi:hypothetical protein
MKSRVLKTTALVGASVLILGAFVAGPAQAKKKKKPKKPVACAPYTPGEKGTGAPISVVTDAATKDAPVTATVATAEGLGTSTNEPEDGDFGTFVSHAYQNIQVDSAAPNAYLYVRVEFPITNDYDVFLRNPDGTSDIYSAGAPPYNDGGQGTGVEGTGHGGHSEGGPGGASENIDGAAATDCQGFTLDIVSSTTQGGDVIVKAWLGEAPAA